MSPRGQIRIGMAGWRFDGWRGTFYPENLPQKRELEFASQRLNSIELNGTFYSMQRPQSFVTWRDGTPDDFVFSIKGSRLITHIRRLENIEDVLANFFGQGLLQLGAKLGPILWQFPPQFSFKPERLQRFFDLLPRTHQQAANYARERSQGSNHHLQLEATGDSPLRHAIEIRHKSFATPEYISLLRENGIALVVADSVKWPVMMDITSDFVYCRLHGSETLYPNGYDAEGIAAWARRVLSWARGEEVADGTRVHPDPGPQQAMRDVFVYFDDDNKVRAPFDAQSLSQKIAELAET